MSAQAADDAPADHSHAVVTANEPRAHDLFPARITAMQPLSPTVLQLRLSVPEAHRSAAAFQPGQWVDFHIPAVSTIGGYSLCSTPRTLASQGVMELAVKRSTHPPAAWVHAEAAVGSEVQMRVGGSFVYETEQQQQQPEPAAPAAASSSSPAPVVRPQHAAALFLVGGVGITPIISMLRQRAELAADAAAKQTPAESSPGASSGLPRTVVLYSARSASELVYRSELESLAVQYPQSFELYFSATELSKGAHAPEGSWKRSSGSSSSNGSDDSASINSGRVPLGLLRSLVDSMSAAGGHVFVCGPPSMVDELLPIVHNSVGVDSARVHFERWW